MNESEIILQRPKVSRHVHCEFQRPCWKTIRAPIARKNHIYLPYICSYQSEGDLEKCGLRDTFEEKKKEAIINGEI